MKNLHRVQARALEIVTALAEEKVSAAARAQCESAKARAPVDTGRLRDSISVKTDGLTASVATDCPYAAAVEFGTADRPPQPFMRG